MFIYICYIIYMLYNFFTFLFIYLIFLYIFTSRVTSHKKFSILKWGWGWGEMAEWTKAADC